MKRFMVLPLGIVVAFASGLVANAATSVETQSFSGTPNFTSVLTFDQFDPSLGALNSILVEVEITSNSGQLLLDNDSTNAAAGTVLYGSDASLSSSDVGLINAAFQPVVATLEATSSGGQSLSPDDGDVEAGGTSQFSTVGLDAGTLAPSTSSDQDSGYISTLAFADYTGLGTYDISVATGQVIDFGGIGGVQFQGNPISVNGEVTITYNYSTPSVPEPTSALVFLGLMAACVRNREAR